MADEDKGSDIERLIEAIEAIDDLTSPSAGEIIPADEKETYRAATPKDEAVEMMRELLETLPLEQQVPLLLKLVFVLQREVATHQMVTAMSTKISMRVLGRDRYVAGLAEEAMQMAVSLEELGALPEGRSKEDVVATLVADCHTDFNQFEAEG